MIIRYADGSYAHGVIYRLAGGTLRAAIAGLDDAVEFRLIRDAWTSDQGVVVTFEFPLETGVDFVHLVPSRRPAVTHLAECAAGGDCLLRRVESARGSDPVN